MCCIQLFYSFFFFLRLALHKNKEATNLKKAPVSVVICAKNEELNLIHNLPFILNQNYPDFEIVVVNHGSTDQTAKVLSDYQKTHNNLKVLYFENDKPGKKDPLTFGINNASNEYLILTDADCRPASDIWIRKFSSDFAINKQIILGYGPHNKSKGVLNYFIRFDTAIIGTTYLSFALSRFGYMGVGRNIGYTKTLFASVNGFESHKEIASGDDDLFIQQAINKSNFQIQTDSDTYCYSNTCLSLKSWISQKKRHQSTSSKYKVINKALLGIYSCSLILMWFSFVSLFVEGEHRELSLEIFCFVLAVKWGIQGSAMRKIKEGHFIWVFPFLELAQNIAMTLIYCLGGKTKKNKW